ncbi:uncharacterized protein BP5553_05699 [Venustampulla echinocandica]|uniref:2EXR domain-containing protein n=1 Tax=Venustampulla echinocandica TaxID=2656787 RepID=A0A370TLH9_9HELO|nr:uncharacterized protein BP5553_05699 [Venustampulla echinocandica]RDL36347.1 hypothetical protein BP5553_05699 [Venustampulla echinocandica]
MTSIAHNPFSPQPQYPLQPETISSREPSLDVETPLLYNTFSSLPTELRLLIWKATLPGPRWINQFPFSSAPVALSVCHESRMVALQSFSPISNHPYSYIDWSHDIIDADFLGDFECILSEADIARIHNLAIRRFDPDDDNPATIWQRNPTYRGWPLCAFSFNCSTGPWGAPDLRGWVLSEENLQSLESCLLIVPAKRQLVFLGGKIMGYTEVLRTMEADLQESKKLTAGSARCACQSSIHPRVRLVQE